MVNIDNVKAWTERLRTTEHEQTRGALMRVEIDRTKTCCLGEGTLMVPGVEVRQAVTGMSVMLLNECSAMAPIEFIDWLGLHQYTSTRLGNYDIRLDIPTDLIDRDAVPLKRLTCSRLNDQGFTFPQIADLIDYFGLSETR